jgi:hypothetical protein
MGMKLWPELLVTHVKSNGKKVEAVIVVEEIGRCEYRI